MPILNIAAVIVVAILISIRTNRRIEATLPPAVFGIILLLFALGICGVMGKAMYVVLMLAILAFGIYVFLWKRKNLVQMRILSLILTPGFAAFLFSCAFIWWFSKDLFVTQWDEFSHWALTVKDMYYRDVMSTVADSITGFKTYPPALAIWEYFFVRLSDTYQENLLYYAYNMLLVTLMMPVFQKITWKKALYLPLACGILFLIPYLYYIPWSGVAWTCLYSDCALALCFAYIMLSYFLEEKPDAFVYLRTGMAAAVLGLMKSSGNFTAAIALAAIVIDAYCRRKGERPGVRLRRMIKPVLLLLIPWAVGALAWKIHLVCMDTPVTWSANRLSLSYIAALFTGTAEAWNYEVLRLFWEKLSEVVVWSHGVIEVSYLGWPVVWMVIGLLAVLCSGRREGKRWLRLGIVLVIAYAVYLCSICGTYLFVFSQSEALQLAGLARYSSNFWMGAVAFAFVFLFDRLMETDNIQGRILLSCSAVVLLMLLVPTEVVSEDVEKHDTRAVVCSQRSGANVTEREYIVQARELLSPDDRVLVIANNNMQWYCIARYELCPNRTSGSATILTEELLTTRVTQDDFDYLWVEIITDEFVANCQALFADEIIENCLYRVERTGDGIMMHAVYAAPRAEES